MHDVFGETTLLVPEDRWERLPVNLSLGQAVIEDNTIIELLWYVSVFFMSQNYDLVVLLSHLYAVVFF